MKIVDLFENKNFTEIFDDFMIDPNRSLAEQLENLKEDMFQAKIGNQIIDIGWYPEFDIKGRFVILIIENQDWENPIFRAEAKGIQKLSSIIKKLLDNHQEQEKRTRSLI